MSLMVFLDGRRFGSGNVLRMQRSARRLSLEYEYVWNGVMVVGTFTATSFAGGAWRGTWSDRAAPGGPHWRGDALLLDTAIGRRRLLTGEWCLTRPKPKRTTWHPWVVVLAR